MASASRPPAGQGEQPGSAWTLPAALDVRLGDIVSLVGGGGKTTAMFRLAGALHWQIVLTTTTHLGREQSDLARHHLIVETAPGCESRLKAALAAHQQVLVTGPVTEQGQRWGGVPVAWVALAAALPGVDLVLVEADGARCLPFKAPADHEPVVPPATTLLVPVVGAEAIGRPVGEVAHRPERVCALTGLGPSESLTAAAVAAVLGHPAGGLKGRPDGARVRVLINKVDNSLRLEAAREVAHCLLREAGGRIEAAVLASLAAARPVIEVRRRVAAVVLAAGRSLRMGGETLKQLLPWDGTTVVRRVVERLDACPSVAGPIVVVTGHRADEVGQALRGTPVRIVNNPDHATGEMLSSLQVGVSALADWVDGCLVVLGDQPWLEAGVLTTLLDGYAAGTAGLVAPTFQGRRGHPVLIDRRHWPELLTLGPGLAPRHLLDCHRDDTLLVPVDTDSIIRDLDTWEQYQQEAGRAG